MPGIKSREEMVSKLEGLLAKAESGQFGPEDISQFQEVVSCAREKVPEFEAGGDMGDMDDDYEMELPEDEGEIPMPPPMPSSPTGPMPGESMSPKRSPMLPPYMRRDGR